ncbi:DUF1624 domain-containing protein [Jiella sp. 40Bstr34]|uniref:DUF1624 domain-containing protein n=1 Tax=Jiella pacifica TaxID=2696469 RepID=A0A6N9TCM9_9HYPH|nr:DUF1624 domain-containing protein [Jiella pacifica]
MAILGVVVYHFGWDLSFFGFASPDMMFSEPVIIFARALAGSFMFLAGVSLVLAHGNGVRWRKFRQRLAKVAAAAAVISIVTFTACLQDTDLQAKVVATQERGQSEFGVDSTPTFFVNGKRYVGALSPEEMSAVIEANL